MKLPLASRDIQRTNDALHAGMGSVFGQGDDARFGTHGLQEGLFLLPNYPVKIKWFPTVVNIQAAAFAAEVEAGEKNYFVNYQNERLTVLPYLAGDI